MRKLLMMIGMTILCACGIAQEGKMKALYDGLSVEELCKVLEEKFDDPETVAFIGRKFVRMADAYRMVPPHPQVLYWARRARKEKPEESAWAQTYLSLKGDAQDLDLVTRYGREMLQARVAGTNVFDDSQGMHGTWPVYIPSVTNTGPQGGYAEAILAQYWEKMEGVTYMVNGKPVTHKHQSQIPPELLTLAVWFDKKGNPVCNVDLAKYGLTMPVIEPKPTSPGFNWVDYTVTFPPLAEPPSLPRRLLPYALILPAALAALLLTRRRRR
ncbi:MAG: hypothetical protein FWG50_03230 [Kiritimatiellaeota bacterium]|nr:hypothetical protein [Kiritimatiellota bacterium]